MRLVDDKGGGAGQHFAEATLLDGHVGKQQMVVDHDQVGLLRLAAGAGHETFLELRAFGAQAIVRGGGDQRQQAAVVGHHVGNGQVSVHCPRGPLGQVFQLADRFPTGQPSIRASQAHAVQAQVIGSALQQRGLHAQAKRLRNQRQVAEEKLVLQRLGAGRNDRPHTA